MDNYSKDLLRTGIIEAKTGNKASARRYLDRAIYMTRSYDVLAEAWFWMSEVTDDPVEKRKALENCLAHEMHHSRARRSLAILDGKLKAGDVINPDMLPLVGEGARLTDAQRFMCPKCGGKMAFAPDGQTLVCDYCTRGQAVETNKREADEKDFIIAMATMKGHGKPLQEQVFHCNGCGAEFILPPKQISSSCAYCASPHIVNLEKTKDLLSPDGIIPHTFDQKRAVKALIDWVDGNNIKPEKKVDLPRGLYLPLWTFDVGGVIDYTYEVVEQEDESDIYTKGYGQKKVTRYSNVYPILENDLPLPASRKPSSVFLRLIESFDMRSIKPYDPRYLANWPAEIYDVPMADASLDARSQVYAKYKREMPHLLNNVNIVHTSSANLLVESFKLNLLPVWMTELPFDGREHLVLINGQNGVVSSDLPGTGEGTEDGGLFGFLADLLGD